MTKYPRELVIFTFITCCREVYGFAVGAYHVLRQDFEHWTTKEQATPPDLKFMRGLFLSRPDTPKASNCGAFHNGIPKGRVILTRVFAVHRGDGTIEMTFEDPPDGALRAVPMDLLGPDRVTLPAGPISQVEFDRWLWELKAEKGYTQRFSKRFVGSPRFEMLRLGPSVTDVRLNASLAWWGSGNARILVVSLANAGDVEVPQLHVDWTWDPDASTELRETYPPSRPGRIELRCSDSAFNSTLRPGQTMLFCMEPEFLGQVRHHVVALSQDKYLLSVGSIDQEVFCFDNTRVAHFLAS